MERADGIQNGEREGGNRRERERERERAAFSYSVVFLVI
jgi:hypothetical protein